ncbi:MAG: hypothetical protein K6G42_02880 [Lachnospiraceae bacterium]|nr:hypothetical protein [Lachnospiraceae bacterium]
MGLQDKNKEKVGNKESVFRTNTFAGPKSKMLDQQDAFRTSRKGTIPGPVKKTDKAAKKDLKQPEEKIRKVGNIEADDKYFERMLANSSDKNLALKIREDDLAGWEGYSEVASSSYIQKRPTARQDKLFGSSENSLIKAAKRTFRNADLCTVRERIALTDYFNKHPLGSDPTEGAEDEVRDSKLTKYINSLLNFNFDATCLTDDYLSQHIAEVYGFSQRLCKYNNLKKQYPNFFNSIPETKRISLDLWAESATSLRQLLEAHIHLHGIELPDRKNRNENVSLWQEDPIKALRHRTRELEKNAYEQKHREFIKTAFDEKELKRAKLISKHRTLVESEEAIKELKERLLLNEDTKKYYGDQVNTALEEINKAETLRSSFAREQRANLQNKAASFTDIKKTTRKIYLCTKHIEQYTNYLYFLDGHPEFATKELSEFLVREKHEDLLEPIKFRAELNCIEEGLFINQRIKEKAPYNKKIKAPQITMEQFYEKKKIYEEGKAKSEGFKKLEDAASAKMEAAKQKAKIFAKENHLVKNESRFATCFCDPKGEFIKTDEDYMYVCLASAYKPTDATPKEVRKIIAEKGIKPYVDMILSIKNDQFKDYDLGNGADYNAEDYFRKKTIIQLGMDMGSVLNTMNKFDYSVSDDDYVKLKAFGVLDQGFATSLSNYEKLTKYPIFNLLAKDGRLTQDPNEIYDNVFFEAHNNRDAISNPEVKAYTDKYSREKLGYEVDYIRPQMGEAASADISALMAEHINALRVLQSVRGKENADLEAEYKKAEAQIRKSLKTEKQMLDSEFESEKAEMKVYFPNATDDMARTRFALKKQIKNHDLRMTDEQITRWKRAFNLKSSSSGAADIRSFKCLLKPVERDTNNKAVKSEYLNNYLENQQDINDYLAGGESRKRVVKKFALDILDLGITREHMTKDYIDKNILEMNDKSVKLNSFLNIAKEFEDFLESDEFTEDQRDRFRMIFTYSQYLPILNQVVGVTRESYGLDQQGNQLENKSLKTNAEKARWQAEKIQTLQELQEGSYTLLGEKLKAQDEMENKFNNSSKEIKDRVRNLSKIHAVIHHNNMDHNARVMQFREKYDSEKKKQDERWKKYNAETDPAKRAELKREWNTGTIKLNELYVQYGFDNNSTTNIWDKDDGPSGELVKYSLGLITADKLSDKAKIFADDNGIAMFTAEEIKQARFADDKANITGKFGDVSDEVINTRLKIHDWHDGFINAFSREERKRYEKVYGSKAFSSEDIRSFSKLFLPVKRDALGNVLPGYEENAKKNTETIESYMSGDQEKKNTVLKEMAEEVLKLDLSPEVFTEEYFLEHTEEVLRIHARLFNFSNFYMGHLDFYTGDAFSDEQKAKLNRWVGGNTSLTMSMVSQINALLQKQFISANGQDLQDFNSITDRNRREASIAKLKEQNAKNAGNAAEDLKRAFDEDAKATETDKIYWSEISAINHLAALERKKDGKASLSAMYGDVNELIYKKKNTLTEDDMKKAAGFFGLNQVGSERKEELKRKYMGSAPGDKLTGVELAMKVGEEGFDKARYDADSYESKLKSNEKLYARCGAAIDQIAAKYRADEEAAVQAHFDFVDAFISNPLVSLEDRAIKDPEVLKKKRDENEKKLQVKLDELRKKLYNSLKVLEAYIDVTNLVTNESFSIAKDTETVLIDKGLTQAFGVVLADMLILRNEELEPEIRKAEEEAKKQEEAKKAEEEAKKQEEAKKAEEEAKKQAEAKKAEEEVKKQAEAPKTEEVKKQEEAPKTEEVKKQAEVKKAEEIKLPDNIILGEDDIVIRAGKKPVVKESIKESIKELRKIYTKEAKKEHEKALITYMTMEKKPLIKELPRDRNHLVLLRGPYYGVNIYTLYDDGTHDHEQTWVKDADPVLKLHLDWLMQYFRVNDPSLDLNMEQGEPLKELQHKEYNVSHELPGLNENYEIQDIENCFCCTAVAMISNMYAKRNKLDHYEKRGTQYDMRKYQPRLMKFDPNLEYKAVMDLDQYAYQAKDLYKFCGEGKTRPGNIFEDADYILDTLAKDGIEDVCVNRMNFTIPDRDLRADENEQVKAHNQMEIFKEKVADVLSKGDVVGVFRTIGGFRHYVTVTGISGNTLTYYDSSGYKGASTKTSVDRFFSLATTVEMQWLSDMEAPEKLTEEYSNLTYDEKTGFGLKEIDLENVRYVGHTKGVTLRKEYGDDVYSMNGVAQSIYIPNPHMKAETMTYEEFEAFYNEQKALREREGLVEQMRGSRDAVQEKQAEEFVNNAVSGMMVSKEEQKAEEKKEEEKKAEEQQVEEKKEEEKKAEEQPAEEKKEEEQKAEQQQAEGKKEEEKKEEKKEEEEPVEEFLRNALSGMVITRREKDAYEKLIDSIEAERNRLSELINADSKKTGKKVTKSQKKEYGKAIIELAATQRSIMVLKSFLSKTLPLPMVSKEGKTDDDVFESESIVGTMVFKRLYDELVKGAKQIQKTNPGLAGMITKLKEQSTRDCALFREKALEYREIAKSDPELQKKKLTWEDALKYTRSDFYNLDDGSFKITTDGAGSSQLLVISKKNKQSLMGSDRVFFRKEDKVPPDNIEDLLSAAVNGCDLIEEDKKATVLDKMRHVFMNKGMVTTLRTSLHEAKLNKTSTEKIGKLLIDKDPEFGKVYSKKDKNAKMKLGQVYLDVFGDYTKLLVTSMKDKEYSAKIRTGRNLSNRNVATKRLASIMGIGDLICDSRTAVIKKDGKELFGNLMVDSGGKPISDDRSDSDSGTLPFKCHYSAEVFPQHYALQVFDLICGQVDRHSNNFHGIVKDGSITQIRGIDNDLAFGDLSFKEVEKGRNRIRPLSTFAVLGMPKVLIERIMGMNKEYLYYMLGDILDEQERKFLWDRLKGVQDKIRSLGKAKDSLARWDEKQGKLVFKLKEDEDDIIRALKMTINIQKMAYDDYKKVERENKNKPKDEREALPSSLTYSLFLEPQLDEVNLNQMLLDRGKALGLIKDPEEEDLDALLEKAGMKNEPVMIKANPKKGKGRKKRK